MNSIKLRWPGGEDHFRLCLGELRALQSARNAGPEQIFNRLRSGQWEVDDLIQVLRFGIIGAGGDDPAVRVTELIDLHPLAQFKITAIAVLAQAILGALDDPVGKPDGEVNPPES